MSSIIANGQLQPRLLALLGYATLCHNNNESDEEAKKLRKRSETIATEEVNFIPCFVTNSCVSSKCLML